MPLTEYIKDQIWLSEYPIRYAGCDFSARMTVIRLSNGELMLHSPCKIDAGAKAEIDQLGDVSYIVAPGSYHYFYIASAQAAFPEAQTYLCPGIERKRADIKFDWFLGDKPPTEWEEDLDQCLLRGNKFIWEVAFLHKPSDTLILVDLVENITDKTEGVNWVLRFWWKRVFNMWNNPKPAPEYQFGWKDKRAARQSLEKILDWNFTRVIIAHGDSIESNANEVVRTAWAKPLSFT